MIISKATTQRSAQAMESYLHPLPAAQNLQQQLHGREVMVLVAGVYSGPNNKALAPAQAGDRIVVAAGRYVETLIADGYVALPEAEQTEATPLEPAATKPAAGAGDPDRPTPPVETTTSISPPADAPENAAPPEPWRELLPAGLNEHLAQVTWEAGIHSKEDVLRLYQDEGINGLIAINGIGAQTARRLLRWAGVTL